MAMTQAQCKLFIGGVSYDSAYLGLLNTPPPPVPTLNTVVNSRTLHRPGCTVVQSRTECLLEHKKDGGEECWDPSLHTVRQVRSVRGIARKSALGSSQLLAPTVAEFSRLVVQSCVSLLERPFV